MKKKTIVAIAIAAVLIVAGIGLVAVGFEMGGGPLEMYNKAVGRHPQDLSGNIGSWSDGYVHGAEVDSVVVNWVSGSVVIEAADVDNVTFAETSDVELNEEQKLSYHIDNGVLYINYLADDENFSMDNFIGLFGSDHTIPAKQLTITVPKEMRSISVDTTSADISLSHVDVEQLLLDSTSGRISVTGSSADNAELGSTSGDILYEGFASNFTVSATSGSMSFAGQADVFYADSTSGKISFSGMASDFTADAVSGDVFFEGSTNYFSAETGSGDISAVMSNMPTGMELDTISGEVELSLPSDSRFELEFDTISGSMYMDFEALMHGGEYVVGGGGAEISVDTGSGNCTVKKNK